MQPIDPDHLASALEQAVVIDEPALGRVGAEEAARESRLWPVPGRFGSIQRLALTVEGARKVEEFYFQPAAPDHGLPIDPSSRHGLPVALVTTATPDGPHVRMYSAHQLVADRAPILPVDTTLVPQRSADDVLGRYFDALHRADLEATLALWEPEGMMQHSNGLAYVGGAALRTAFTKFFASGAITLRYCNKTDSDGITALEAYMPSGRPAVAVYQRGPSGLMQAARLYL